MINREIREAMRIAGMTRWQLADAAGVSEPTLYRWLRHELSDEKRQRLLAAITSWHAEVLKNDI